MKKEQYCDRLKFCLAWCPVSDSCQYRLNREEFKDLGNHIAIISHSFPRLCWFVADGLC